MTRLVPILFAAMLAGCMTPTWKGYVAGSPLAEEKVILVGSFAAVPPINQEREGPPPRCYGGPCGANLLVGGQEGNLMGLFTPDLSESMRMSINRMPFSTFDWAWIPMEGTFAVEVPRRDVLYLRGFQYYTKGDDGAVRFELPGRVPLRPGDRVVYVGEIRLVRTGERRVSINDRKADALKALEVAGLKDVLALPWRTQLFTP
jgi:hypothetical protein